MRKYFVLGLGVSGRSALAFLAKRNEHVKAWDDSSAKRDKLSRIETECLCNPQAIKFEEITHLVLSPGIPHTWPTPNPLVAAAREHGVSIISDIELYALHSKEHYTNIGVTGTNGKSTTCALTAHVLQQISPTFVGGNFGPPVLEALEFGYDYNVFELSSYQLELAKKPFLNAAILLNISPDHLMRHGGWYGYVAAKMSIFSLLVPKGKAYICIDAEPNKEIYTYLKNNTRINPTSISIYSNSADIYLENDTIHDTLKKETIKLPVLKIQGDHNLENILCTYAALSGLHINKNTIVHGVTTFYPLPHRQEFCGDYQNIQFINDSKATNITSANRALKTYKNIFWLGGGQAKSPHFDGLYIDNILSAYVYGECADSLVDFFNEKKRKVKKFDTLKEALFQASKDALSQSGMKTVLLSPACASQDQFRDYEDRGEQFKEFISMFKDMHENQ